MTRRTAAAGRRYHHGDLPRAIRDTALAMIAERGQPAFSLRELAARIGVAHGAVYAHFDSKGALLADLAVSGLDSLNRHQRAALARPQPNAVAALLAIARAYLDFARREPGAYRLVFGTDLAALNADSVQAARASAASLMLEVIADGLRHHLLEGPDAETVAAALWAAAHGLAHLVISGHLEELPGAAADLERTIEFALLSTVRGVLTDAGRDALPPARQSP